MLASLPTSPDGIGIAVAEWTSTATGWHARLAVPGDLHGPPGILQGGLSAGLVRAAALASGPAPDGMPLVPSGPSDPVTTVLARLRRPTPVGALLDADVVREGPNDLAVTIRDGDEVTVIGEVELAGPPPVPHLPDLLELGRAPAPAPVIEHAYPTCFVCGSASARGLRIPPHPVAGLGQNIAPWTPDERVDDGSGHVHPLAISAVLDCPGVWAGFSRLGTDDPDRQVALLAEYRIQWFAPVALGEPCRTLGLVDDIDGRKLRVRTALVDQGGRIRAMAAALHILAPQAPAVPAPARPLT